MMWHKQEVMICRLDLMHLQLDILFSLMTYRRTGVQTGLLEFTDPEVSFVRFFSLSFGWPGCNFVMMPRPSLLIWWLWCRSEQPPYLWMFSPDWSMDVSLQFVTANEVSTYKILPLNVCGIRVNWVCLKWFHLPKFHITQFIQVPKFA